LSARSIKGNKMNIKFLGSSMTNHKDSRTPKDTNPPNTFVDIIQEKYSYNDNNNTYHGIGGCSEERILFFLKKMKNLDMVIIFHTSPSLLFVPGFVRDVYRSKIDKDELDYLKKSNQVLAEDLTIDEVNDLLIDNKKYFHHQDLQMNRFLGALIQIDQYCTAKQIPVIHFIHNRIPTWFKFTSGIVDTEVYKMDKSQYYIGYQNSYNAINEEGNKIIAEKIIEYIENYDNLKIDGKE